MWCGAFRRLAADPDAPEEKSACPNTVVATCPLLVPAAADWVKQFPASQLRNQLISQVSSLLAAKNPHSAIFVNEAAWICALGPDAVADYRTVIELMEHAVATCPQPMKPGLLNTLGISVQAGVLPHDVADAFYYAGKVGHLLSCFIEFVFEFLHALQVIMFASEGTDDLHRRAEIGEGLHL